MPARWRIEPAQALVAVAIAATGVMLLVWFGELTFWRDEWAILLHRRGFDPGTFLDPHYEHIAISLIATYKGLLEIFGMDSPRPFQVVAVATFLTSVALVFVYFRRCVGGWLALASVLPILVLGPSWDDLLWPFQLGFFGTMSAGLAALLALERNDRRGDLAATVLLVLAVSFSSLGVPFAVGAAVAVGWGPDRARRAYVAALPLLFYALWWLGWGHEADSYVSLQNLATLPGYVLDGFASSTSSLLGLAAPSAAVGSPLDWGRAVLAAGVVLAIWRLHRVGRMSRTLWTIIAIAVSFWALAGLNASIFREPTSGRYQYMGAIFVVLIAAELMRGFRPARPIVIAALAISACAALSNLNALDTAYRGLTGFGDSQPADLAALELVRGQVDPAFELTEDNSGVDYLGEVDAASYYSAVDAFGSPAFTPAELAAAPEAARASADRVFAAALGVALDRGAGAAADPACTRVQLGGGPQGVTLAEPLVTVGLSSPGQAVVRLRRYASFAFPIRLGSLGGGESGSISIEPDGSDQPWELGLSGSGTVEVCESAG